MSMTDKALLLRLDRIESVEAIRARLHVYCRGVDRRDPDLIRAAFWPDAKVEYGMYTGNGHEFSNSICGTFAEGGVDNTAHLLGNVTIAVDGDTAHSEAYLHAHHRVRRPDGTYFDSIFGGRYHDRFERRNGIWRIIFRRLVFDWFRNFPDTGDWTVGEFGVSRATATIGGPGKDIWPELNAALASLTS